MSAKGYVVRGKDEDGDWVSTDARAANEAAANYWISCADWQLSDVAILAVSEDGSETPLPSYEEALAESEVLRARAEQHLVNATREESRATAATALLNAERVKAERLKLSHEGALAALSQTQDLLSKATDDVLRMSAEIERLKAERDDERARCTKHALAEIDRDPPYYKAVAGPCVKAHVERILDAIRSGKAAK